MEKSIVDCLKLFLEKYFILSVTAIVLTFITFLAVPSDLFIIKKLGNTMFSVFSFCSWFLILELFKFIFKSIVQFFNVKRKQRYLRKSRKEETLKVNKELLERLWTEVDSMSPRDYELLMSFITNGNQPYVTASIFCGSCLLNSEWVHKSLCKEEERVSIPGRTSSNSNEIPLERYADVQAKYQYILKDEVYQILKYSQDKYGRISHFNR